MVGESEQKEKVERFQCVLKGAKLEYSLRWAMGGLPTVR